MLKRTPQLRQDNLELAGTVGEILCQSGPAKVTGYLAWFAVGVGFYPVAAGIEPYDQRYFDRFGRQARTLIGRALMRQRVDFVARHYHGELCDVGIGSGAFIEARPERTLGWDVNPAGLQWLRERGLICNPYLGTQPALSLWDVLEHLPDFAPLLENCRQWLFVSLPIFRDPVHAHRSKHFRPDEHCWYFTAVGLIWVMRRLGFVLAEHNRGETLIGREDIMSFAFKRET